MRTVIVVLDNGESYSDHRLYFVEVRVHFLKDFEKLVTIDTTHSWKILAVADKLKWREKNQTIRDYQRLMFWHFTEVSNEQWATIGRTYRRWLFTRWGRESNNKRDPEAWNRLRGVK